MRQAPQRQTFGTEGVGDVGSKGQRRRLVEVPGGEHQEIQTDTVLLLTGYHPDFELLERSGVTLGQRREPIFNPETMETSVPGLFVAGGLVGGLDTGAIFIENGRFHGEKIVRRLLQAAG